MGQSNYREGVDEGIFELCRKHGLGSVGAVFLGHDGSMTRLLELSIGGPVSLRTIGQKVVPCPELPSSFLEVRAGEPVNERDILILRSLDERPLLHARSYTPLSRLEPGFRRDMMRADIPIGRIMRAHRIEARREILEVGYLDSDPVLGSLLRTPGPYIWRRYNIITGGKPLITIRESLPVSFFWELPPATKS